MSYIYVMQNDGLPGLVQIGVTDNTPEARAQELSSITRKRVPRLFEGRQHAGHPLSSSSTPACRYSGSASRSGARGGAAGTGTSFCFALAADHLGGHVTRGHSFLVYLSSRSSPTCRNSGSVVRCRLRISGPIRRGSIS
jgi:hypothetical protein